jgi:hypothetical protein
MESATLQHVRRNSEAYSVSFVTCGIFRTRFTIAPYDLA